MRKFYRVWAMLIEGRPFTAVTVAFLFGVGCGIMGATDAPFVYYWILSALMAAVVCTVAYMDRRRIAAILAAIMFATPFAQARAEEKPFQPAGPAVVGVGIGLIIGVGVIAVLAVRACHKRVKQATDALTNGTDQAQSPLFDAFSPAAVSGGHSGGWFCNDPDYCSDTDGIVAAFEPPAQHGVVLEATVDDAGVATILHVTHVPEERLVSWDQMMATAQSVMGVTYTGTQGAASYSLNGVEATADAVPFSWNGSLVTVYPERPQHLIVLEEAHDLSPWTFWSEVSRISVPSGEKLVFSTTTQIDGAFYRIRTLTP